MRVISPKFILLLALSVTYCSAQAETLWQDKIAQAKSQQTKPQRIAANHARYLHVNQGVLGSKFSELNLATEITLPLPNDSNILVKLSPSPILSKDLAEQYPSLMTFEAQQVDNPKNIGRFSISHLGLFGFFRYNSQWMLLSPRYQNEAYEYASYWYKDSPIATEATTRSADFLLQDTQLNEPKLALKTASTGDKIHTYRLAISTTAEYTEAVGGTTENVVAELMNLVNRINQILLIDAALQFELIDNQDIIFFDAVNDPFTNSDAATDIEANQDVVDQAVGSENYDIGHVLGTNGGGLAYLGVVCHSQYKAQGYTGLNTPQGERFYIDLVAHELGHQLGASHTFNATNASSCEDDTRNANSAYEPGSGSTIMSYSGLCDSQNLQTYSDPYFHSISIQNIRDFVDSFSGQRCGKATEIANAIPEIKLEQTTYTIPANTPFMLSGTVTDANNDSLTYTWEQFDNGGTLGATNNLSELNSDNGSNPLFRSYSPVDTAQRYFPQLDDVLLGTTSLGETYATTDRGLNFRLTARDNKGGVNQQDIAVSVTTSSQTFSIDTPTEWKSFSKQVVTWNIGDTVNSPIDCENVDISVIENTDAPIITPILTQTPNDGQQIISMPNLSSSAARLVLTCSNNIFYAISPGSFSIISAEPIAPSIESQNNVSFNEDTQRTIDFSDLNVTDSDSDYPQDFSLHIQDGDNFSVNQQTLTPDSNFNGTLTVLITVNDGSLDSNVFPLQVVITSNNDAPIANNDTISILLNSDAITVDVLANDTDVDMDALTISDVTYTGQGQVEIVNQQLTYTPAAGFTGSESITYTISDGTLTNEGTVNVQVNSETVTEVSNGSGDSGGGSMLLLSLLSFLCFSVKLYTRFNSK